ncbi:MAG: hypothetical protein SFY81_04560 [Verrucomicrobiota bacterium]|nr:hypothetical protein [Verrucomicrobiota bacterium]
MKPLLHFICLSLLLDFLTVSGVEPMTLQTLAEKAPLIIRATPIEMNVSRNNHGQIVTRYRMQVSEFLKGTAQTPLLDLVQSGGILGEQRVVVTGQPNYQLDQEVVVFCVRNDSGEWTTSGMWQGKFDLQKKGNELLLSRPDLHAEEPASPLKISLNELKRLLLSTK